jgi:hypothetical protein
VTQENLTSEHSNNLNLLFYDFNKIDRVMIEERGASRRGGMRGKNNCSVNQIQEEIKESQKEDREEDEHPDTKKDTIP